MTTRRTFTPDEINKILDSLAGDDLYDLGNGFTATRTARGLSPLDKGNRPGFRIDKGGKWGEMPEDSSPEDLAAISAALWEKGKEFFPDDTADLIPDELKEEKDPLEGTIEGLIPLELREKPDREDLEPDLLGLTPDSLRAIIKDPALARRLATGKGTIEDLLTPESLKGE